MDIQSEINQKVAISLSVFQKWSHSPLEQRISYAKKYQEILDINKEALSLSISKETGKPLWDSRTEVAACIGKVTLSIESYYERTGTKIKDHPSGKSVTRHHPQGVVAVFGPYNFPAHLPGGHIIPALLAGNTVIFKPSELTPSVGEQLFNFWKETGLPEGVLQLIQGGPETGKILSNHPDINGIFFTGSWKTGKILSEQCGSRPQILLALEMGGNNPLIVSKVSDLKAAAYITIQSAFISSGQRCTCARRLIVVGENHTFLETLLQMTATLRTGYYTEDPQPFMGPVINRKAALEILQKQENLISLGGVPLKQMILKEEAMLSPGIIDVTAVKELPDEEIFGPLLQVIRVKNLEEAIQVANHTKYGLAAGILTDQKEEYENVLAQAKAGIVNWNTSLTGASSAAPFGGIGRSGNHRPSAYYAADYCSYPVASLENEHLSIPKTLPPGITL